jgi:hypothetical protein
MYARAVEDAAKRLDDLGQEAWEEAVVAGLALVSAVAATHIVPSLALPLLVGGLAVAFRAMRTFWRGWDLLDRLKDERDAYTIRAVRAEASKAATIQSRRRLAEAIRWQVQDPGPACAARIAACADDLLELASELEDADLVLDPASAVSCARLVSEAPESPLLSPAIPAEDLRSSVIRIRAGFERRAGGR